jgi:ABC-2 type transport system permease protein
MVRRFFSQALLYFKAQQAAFRFEEFLCFEAGYPLITLIFYCLLAAYSFSTSDLTHWVVGNSFLLCVNTCVFSLGNTFVGERYYGRIRSIVVAPMSKLAVVLQRGFFPALVAVGTVIAGFLIGSLIFGVDFTGINLGLFALVVLAAMFAATGFGLLLSAFGLVTDSMHFVLNLASYVLMIFCGANFPVSQLGIFGNISWLLPLTRTIKAADMLFGAVDGPKLFALLGGELAVGAVYFAAAACVIRIVERVARRKATLEVF